MDFVPAMKLGFGLMRLPRLNDNTIDVAQISDMVDRFILHSRDSTLGYH
jgi:predicted aldo/keto reductase-like oxidoreductase